MSSAGTRPYDLPVSGEPKIAKVAQQYDGPFAVEGVPGYFPALQIFGPPVPLPKLGVPYELTSPESIASIALAIKNESPAVSYICSKPEQPALPDHIVRIGCMAYVRRFEFVEDKLRVIIEYDQPITVVDEKSVGNELYSAVTPLIQTGDSDPVADLQHADELLRRAVTYLEKSGHEQRAKALATMETSDPAYRLIFTSYAIAALLDLSPQLKLEVLAEGHMGRRNALVESGIEALQEQLN